MTIITRKYSLVFVEFCDLSEHRALKLLFSVCPVISNLAQNMYTVFFF